MQEIFLETPRLILRRMGKQDLGELSPMLQDKNVMWAREAPFREEDVREWLDKVLAFYARCGLGYFLAVEKADGCVVGQVGLLPCRVQERERHEIAYILRRDRWGKGYARDATAALAQYAFQVLHLQDVIFQIRPQNLPSRRVAESLGAAITSSFVRHYRGIPMPHLIYELTAERMLRTSTTAGA